MRRGHTDPLRKKMNSSLFSDFYVCFFLNSKENLKI